MVTMKRWCLFLSFIGGMLFSSIDGLTMDITDIQSMDGYRVVSEDDPNTPLAVFDTYADAYAYYQNGNDDWLIIQGDSIVAMHEGLVFLNASDCNTTIDLIDVTTDENGYTNACYGIDGYYSHSNSNGTYYAMHYSGNTVWVSANHATLVPLSYLDTTISKYRIIDGELVHFIKGSLYIDTYANTVVIDQSPTYLTEGQDYYSPDGHYFYDDLQRLFDDLTTVSHGQAINADQPYYNFYQYLSHRSLAKVDETTLNTYFNAYGMVETMSSYSDLGHDSISDDLTQSMLFNSANAFLTNQYRYGVNGLMMAALSLNESGLGRSHLAYTRNNLFGHAAYDSAVEANASRYLSVSNSIASHGANYIVESYCNPDDFTYHGCFFGNKESGMNVSYASDPYWGEKAAGYLYDMDSTMGLNMKDSYQIGLFSDDEAVDVLIDSDDPTIAYSYAPKRLNSVLINGESGNYYQIVLDHEVTDQWGNTVNVGYIPKDVVNTIIGEMDNDSQMVQVNLDANGGTFADGNISMSYTMDPRYPSLAIPLKDGGQFQGYELVSDDGKTMNYRAIYHDTVGLTMVTLPKTIYETNERFDCTNGKVMLQYRDGTNETVDLTMDMIEGYRFDINGIQRVYVRYGGQTTSFTVEVSSQLDQTYRYIQDTINATIDYGSATLEEISAFKTILDNANTLPILTMGQYRQLDAIMVPIIHENGFTYHLEGEDLLGISNLSMALDFNRVKADGWFENVITIGLNNTDLDDTIQTNMAVNHYINDGYTIASVYDLSLEHNRHAIKLNSPLVLTIATSSVQGNAVSALVIDGDAVYQLPVSIGSTTLSMLTEHTGTLVILTKPTTQILSGTDPNEVITMDNDDAPFTDMATTMMRLSIFALLVVVLVVWIIFVMVNINKRKKRRRKIHAR